MAMIQNGCGPKRKAVAWPHNKDDKEEAGDNTRTMMLFIVSYHVLTACFMSHSYHIIMFANPVSHFTDEKTVF